MIDSFLNYYYFLSNFYPWKFSYPTHSSKGGVWLNDNWHAKEYKSLEHAYQSYKTENLDEQEYIRNLDTPTKTKRYGRIVRVRDDWESIKYELMLDLVRAKFEDVELAKQLIDTDNETLVEGNYWHDNVWGNCTCVKCVDVEGKNWLGKILMQVRSELNSTH